MNENDIRRIIKDELSDSQFSVAKIPYHLHTGVDSPQIPFNNLIFAPHAFCATATTTGTTAVNVFNAKGATFNLTIQGVFLISNDTTAGNITLSNNGSSVCVIAKGTTAGALVGATSLKNTSYIRGNTLTVVSSSAGNSTLFMTFTST